MKKNHKQKTEDLGTKLTSINILTTIYQNGLSINILPANLDPQLVTNLSNSVAHVIIEWDKMIRNTLDKMN